MSWMRSPGESTSPSSAKLQTGENVEFYTRAIATTPQDSVTFRTWQRVISEPAHFVIFGLFTSDRGRRGRRSELLKAPIKNGSTVQFDGPTAQCACHARLITFVNFSSSSERILILLFLWYKATNFRGIGGYCRLAAPTDFIRGISPGKLDSFRLVSSSVSDERRSVINDYL